MTSQYDYSDGATSPGHLLLGRVRRGLARQSLLILVVMLLSAALGAVSAVSEGATIANAALIWVPLGAGFALLVALAVELTRNRITTPSNLRKYAGHQVLAAPPELTARNLRTLPPDKRTPLGCLAFNPAAPFTSVFRELQYAVRRNKAVAFVAAWPHDGATTVALCTAVSAAQQGRSVIILDCDLRRRTLSKSLGSTATAGLLEACDRPDDWRDLVEEEDETGLHYLPAVRSSNPWRTLVGSPGFTALVTSLRQCYDLVVLDCPPALSRADSGVIAGLADRCVVVTAWDQTPLGAVRSVMQILQRHSSASTDFCLNRVPAGYRFSPSTVD